MLGAMENTDEKDLQAIGYIGRKTYMHMILRQNNMR